MGFTILMMGSTVSQGITAKGQADAQGILLDDKARQEREAGVAEAEIIRRAGERVASSARASSAASGVKVGVGSAGLAEDTIIQGANQDALTAILEGTRKSSASEGDAKQQRLAGKAALKSAYISALAQGASGAASYGKSTGWRTNGKPGYSGTQEPAKVQDRSVYSSAMSREIRIR